MLYSQRENDTDDMILLNRFIDNYLIIIEYYNIATSKYEIYDIEAVYHMTSSI